MQLSGFPPGKNNKNLRESNIEIYLLSFCLYSDCTISFLQNHTLQQLSKTGRQDCQAQRYTNTQKLQDYCIRKASNWTKGTTKTMDRVKRLNKGNTTELRINVFNILRGKWVLVEFIIVLILGEMGID